MKTNAAEKLVLLNEEDYPEELATFLTELRELDAQSGPHIRINEREFERFLVLLRTPRRLTHPGKGANRRPR